MNEATKDLRPTISSKLVPPRVQELYKIKIGRKGKKVQTRSGKEMHLPEKLDHFIVTKRERQPDGSENFIIADEIHSEIGAEPTELDMRFAFDTVEDNWHSEMCYYKGTTKVFQCDGERAVNLNSGNVGECLKAQGEECPCKPFGRLKVLLEASPYYGAFAFFRTTSWETINNLQTTMRMLEADFGGLRELPLRLVIYPATDRHEGGVSTSWKVGIVLRASYEEARTAALEFRRQDRIEKRELKMLAAATDEELEALEDLEGADIAAEFVMDPDDREEVEEAQVQRATDEELARLRERIAEQEDQDQEEEVVEAEVLGEEPDEDVPDFDDAGSAEAADADADASGGGTPAGSDDEELSRHEKLRRRFWALFKENFPYPDDDEKRKDWTEHVVGKRSTGRMSTGELEVLCKALEHHTDFHTIPGWPDEGDGAQEEREPEPEPEPAEVPQGEVDDGLPF